MRDRFGVLVGKNGKKYWESDEKRLKVMGAFFPIPRFYWNRYAVRMENQKRYMNARELSAYLGISEWMIYTYIKRRDIPFIPFGRLVRFDRLAIEKWAEKKTTRAYSGTCRSRV